MNANLNLKTIPEKLKRWQGRLSQHIVFGTVLAILLAYLFIVWRISQLAGAEPSIESQDDAAATANIPRVNKQAIEQISALKESNTSIKSLFDAARNNPFQE